MQRNCWIAEIIDLVFYFVELHNIRIVQISMNVTFIHLAI